MSDRILVLMPRGPAASRTFESLASIGMEVSHCGSLDELCLELGENAAAALVAEECLGRSGVGRLAEAICRRPSPSEFPLVVLGDYSPPDEDVQARLERFEALDNVVLLERPVRMATLVSILRTALARRSEGGADAAIAIEDQDSIDRRERCRLARLVHDDLQQILVAAKLHAGMARRQSPDAECRDGWEEVVGLLDHAIDTTRSLSAELCPPALRDPQYPFQSEEPNRTCKRVEY